MKYALKLKFKASNNEAEYKNLLASLRLAQELGLMKIQAFSYSQIVIGQVTGQFEAKKENIGKYLALIKEAMKRFKKCSITKIERKGNVRTNTLSKMVSCPYIKNNVLFEFLHYPSISCADPVMELTAQADWMAPILQYL